MLAWVDDPAKVAEVSAGARGGLRLWDGILLLALLVALLEPWLANLISLRNFGKGREQPIPPAPVKVPEPTEEVVA